MSLLSHILEDLGVSKPDGRPLYTLPLTPPRQVELTRTLRQHLIRYPTQSHTAALFVLWASDYIRSHFKGGTLKWEFVFEGLGLSETQDLGRELVEKGLRWWHREVRRSEGQTHLYLYSLMAEGGLPQSLLVEDGLYGRVIKGLLAEMESHGPTMSDSVGMTIAARYAANLPKTFQASEDIYRLLKDLGTAIIALRAKVPENIPAEQIDAWLDQHDANWANELPLRLSPDIADRLIRPALRTLRNAQSPITPVARRMLVRDANTRQWHPFVRLAEEGILAAHFLPASAKGLRMRFLAGGNASMETIVYNATPLAEISEGWELRCLNRTPLTLALDLDRPFSLSGFADGRPMGEVEIISALPLPDECPSLWHRPPRGMTDGQANVLIPLDDRAITRGPTVWLLTNATSQPVAGPGVTLGAPEQAPHGRLWPLSGKGDVTLGQYRWRITTGAPEDLPEIHLLAQGAMLPGWRMAGSREQIFLGTPTLYGQNGPHIFRSLSPHNIRYRPARTLMAHIAQWVENSTELARLRYVSLPEGAALSLREKDAGTVELHANGLASGLSLRLAAGACTVQGETQQGHALCLCLSVTGRPPGMLTLQFNAPATGQMLELTAPWPTHNGIILAPDNTRLEHDTPIAVGALRGWMAIVPPARRCKIQLRTAHQCIDLRIEGETPLAVYIPLIRSMLAHGGPDSDVRLSLVTDGMESRRLEIRRYHRQSRIQADGTLCLGIPRNEHVTGGNAFTQLATKGAVNLHATNINRPGQAERHQLTAQGAIDLAALLPSEANDLWLVQATLDGQVQRAAIWSPGSAPISPTTRDQRIEAYGTWWEKLSASDSLENRAVWREQWSVIQAAMEGGDAGMLDQVQALAAVPQALIRLVLEVPTGQLLHALSLDTAAPIFWPVLPVQAFIEAVGTHYASLVRHYSKVCDSEVETARTALNAMARRIDEILVLHPELASHFAAALVQAGLIADLPPSLMNKIMVAPREDTLITLAQQVARRHEWVPDGIPRIEPDMRLAGFSGFNTYIQKIINAPMVAAEMAAQPQPPHIARKRLLTLANLRLIDPGYFDDALPIALAIVLDKANS